MIHSIAQSLAPPRDNTKHYQNDATQAMKVDTIGLSVTEVFNCTFLQDECEKIGLFYSSMSRNLLLELFVGREHSTH